MSRASVLPVGTQSFHDRLPGRRQFDSDVPTISTWRCNLTGLSQAHNLYFVAYGEDIYTYAPQFPTHALPQQPALILTSQPSDPRLSGYLDAQQPHSINNLIVQHLGNEEVVAVVRDDGDCDAFLIRHIAHAIARRAEAGNAIGALGDEVKPIFQSNVTVSAWGLAIHAEARMIAVSSNAHQVNIFKFALLDEYSDADDDRRDGDDSDGDPSQHRRTDVIHRVVNGESNIPYISFCNTGDDPGARWLLTTDISGVCRVMDLHRMQPAQAFRFGRPLVPSYVGTGFDRLNAGWLITFLDRRSFVEVGSVENALGVKEGATGSNLLPRCNENNLIWDLSEAGEQASSEAFCAPKTPRGMGESRRQRHQDLASSSRPTTSNIEPDEAEGGVSLPGPDSSDGSEEDSEEDSEDSAPEVADEDDDPEDEGTEDSIAYNAMYNGRRIYGNEPQFVRQTDVCEDLPCPILHASQRNIYLLQPTNQRHNRSPFSPPMLGFAHPLKQKIELGSVWLNNFERLNMNAYIPSIGVVVCASQKGRAIVLELSKLKTTVKYPPELQSVAFKTNYTMRSVVTLPFASQEKAGQRPFAPLHGIATGPIQGTEGLPDGQKRWRLMMMYQDHSILSYEICRRRESVFCSENVIV
ncbi:hypothetical protein K431DRAFT_60069 [Polychaeton citri CBS 116435]|uniref:Uncharacterized protein n=1 Tax=Polychaeton citri CBS 116435 TaxID=1314669 RepID=A0A9P4URI6_9PEZI|nr:hypothetical protein K431DRAFT_60069 [Polychaeton citri CBS 116435]